MPPVSVACNTIITVKHVLIECADLVVAYFVSKEGEQ